jgi:hypothetical protein
MSDSINVYLSDEDLEKINGGMEVRVKTAEGLLLTFFPPVIARPAPVEPVETDPYLYD